MYVCTYVCIYLAYVRVCDLCLTPGHIFICVLLKCSRFHWIRLLFLATCNKSTIGRIKIGSLTDWLFSAEWTKRRLSGLPLDRTKVWRRATYSLFARWPASVLPVALHWSTIVTVVRAPTEEAGGFPSPSLETNCNCRWHFVSRRRDFMHYYYERLLDFCLRMYFNGRPSAHVASLRYGEIQIKLKS